MKRGFSITRRAGMWLTIGAVALLAGVISFVTFARLSIEFTGGIQLQTMQEITQDDVETLREALATDGIVINEITTNTENDIATLLIKLNITDEQVQSTLDTLETQLITQNTIESQDDIISLSFIGPSIGDYIKRSAIRALAIGVGLMAIYLMIAFGEMRKVIPPYILAVITILTMLFDIAIPAGMYGLWMSINPTIQVNSIFVIAILTTIGYSINDTIIILDRIKENTIAQLEEKQHNQPIEQLINTSIRQTMRRSLGTSFSTLIVVIALYIFGTGVIQEFAFVIGWGIVAGTFSSVFIAANLLYVMTRKS